MVYLQDSIFPLLAPLSCVIGFVLRQSGFLKQPKQPRAISEVTSSHQPGIPEKREHIVRHSPELAWAMCPALSQSSCLGIPQGWDGVLGLQAGAAMLVSPKVIQAAGG
jgi:hypothetical protein